MKKVILSCALLLPLVACKTVPDEYGLGDPIKPLTQKEKMLVTARNAALENQHNHIKKGSLTKAETIYRANPKSPKAVFEYAHLLRKVDLLSEAEIVLKPFAINPKLANDAILLEYAKIQLKKGEFDAAQIYAQEAMGRLDTAQSRMVLGVAVDAQGHHQAAENHFRTALKMSNLDIDLQNSIKNNLALCLLSQGKSSEAESLLRSINLPTHSHEGGIVEANRHLSRKL